PPERGGDRLAVEGLGPPRPGSRPEEARLRGARGPPGPDRRQRGTPLREEGGDARGTEEAARPRGGDEETRVRRRGRRGQEGLEASSPRRAGRARSTDGRASGCSPGRSAG